MNAWVDNIDSVMTTTTNGMPARISSANKCVDLFFKFGASRGKDIVPDFIAAFVENPEVAMRILLWGRDVRGGAGERQLFRNVMQHLETTNPEVALRVINSKIISEVGRFDDYLVFKTDACQKAAFDILKEVISDGIYAKKQLGIS